MRFLFVMDPAETMHPSKDTTFAFLRAAGRRGHRSFHCLPHHLSNEARNVKARARPIRVSDTEPHVLLGDGETLEVATLDAVFVRKDPPFDTAYLHLTHQLELVKDRVLVVNDPRGIRDANEKLFAFEFSEWMPRSLVTSRADEIVAFVAAVGGMAVLKPIDGAGGAGVVVLKSDDRNTRSLADIWTDEGKRLTLVQEYQPAVRVGDKRVLVLDGAPIGAILRVPREDDVRANIHAGGEVKATELTPRERELVAAVGPTLSAHGLWFVGLDLIGERLIEVNVTSPTGIQELSRFSGRPVEEDVMAWVEARAPTKKQRSAPGA
jgi:glutathione synthase